MDVDELWSLISTADGWKSWLVDDADVAVAPMPRRNCDRRRRRARRCGSTPSIDGRSVGFSWWDRDDPSSASYVQLDIVELPDGRSQLHITERFVGADSRRATMSCTAGVSWEVRIVSLWLLAVALAP